MIIRCFELSGDISLAQLQDRQDRGGTASTARSTAGTSTSTSSTVPSSGAPWNIADGDTVGVGPIVETAIQRSPILYIRSGELNKGIGRFRELLRVVETRTTQSLRQTLARQLAEVLLRGICERTYQPIDVSVKTVEDSHPKPHKYSSDNLFIPKDENEETLLLLLISESIATREAVLNRSLELTDARQHTFHNTTAVYDLLTITLVKRAQFTMLSETFERAMRFSCEEFHIWYQFALSLMCSEKYVRAYLVLKECIRLDPKNIVVYLQAAKLCYECLDMVPDGIEYCQKAIDLSQGHQLQARCHLYIGIGYSLRSDEVRLQSQRQTYQKKAVEAFNRSLSLDKNDHLAYFHLGLQLSLLRRIPEALKYVRKALRRRSDHLHSLHLLALLLSAQKQFDEAYKLIEATLAEYPDNFSLMFTKCKLELEVSGVETALQTCRTMLLLWKNLYESSIDSDERGTGLLERITNDHRSLLQLQLYELSDRDSGSVRAESVAASRLEQTLSEVASSIGSGGAQPRPGPQQTWVIHTQIWLQLADLYLGSSKFDSAYACIQEAASCNPVSHAVSYMRGRLSEAKEDYVEAKKFYESAVAINPMHIKSLHRLGIVLHAVGNNRLAEKVLRDAVNYDPTYCQAWHSLGTVLECLGDKAVATECLLTSLELEASSPIQPFNVIPKVFS
jgi:tetratricopeptide (TPR) repeat protein